MAQEVRGYFQEEDPTPVQIKRSLDRMRKAAFLVDASDEVKYNTMVTQDTSLWMRSNVEPSMPNGLSNKQVPDLCPDETRDTNKANLQR